MLCFLTKQGELTALLTSGTESKSRSCQPRAKSRGTVLREAQAVEHPGMSAPRGAVRGTALQPGWEGRKLGENDISWFQR